MNKLILTLLFVVFLISISDVTLVKSLQKQGEGNTGETPTTSGGTPATDWPSEPTTTGESQIHIIGQTKVISSQGLSQSGNSFHVDSASSIYTGSFVFNDVGSTDITADGNKLTNAVVTSANDYNVFFIKNPTDPYEIERINAIISL